MNYGAKTIEVTLEEFERRVDKTDTCWLWKGCLVRGYGQIGRKKDGKLVREYAHRVSYRLYKGRIPEGLVLDHLCKNLICVRPDHLEPVTFLENLRRGKRGIWGGSRSGPCEYPGCTNPRERNRHPKKIYLRKFCSKHRGELYKSRTGA